MPTEKEIIETMKLGKLTLPPLSFRFLELQPEIYQNRRFDALIEASWQNRRATFVVECKSISTPKAFQDGLNRLKMTPFPKKFLPMLLMPFLAEKHLLELEREGMSGMDLCGNGVVIIPGSLAVFRSGGMNRFPSSASIKNIYRLNSSMVARAFLSNPEYRTVQELCAEVNRRNLLVDQWDKPPMNLSTVSKALKSLEEDLVVGRKGSILLLQPAKLLEKLRENYSPPKITNRMRMKIPKENGTIPELLNRQARESGRPFVATGASTVGQYAVMQRGEMVSVYCPLLEGLQDQLHGNLSDRFPNLELIETQDETVFFDARTEQDFSWASPVQVYLELMAGDKRDRETAEQVKSFLLSKLGEAMK